MSAADHSPALDQHKAPEGLFDRIALGVVKVMRVFADAFFSKRYGHRAVVLETVAAVPGMVGGLLQHLKALRHIREDQGWIRELLDEAENERMHLMTFIHIARPSLFERALIMGGQAVFFNAYFFLYLFAPKTAHRVVGYLEEEAVVSYTGYLAQVDSGAVENVAAPQIARDYWKLPTDARLREVIIAVRADEAKHRDMNHGFADALALGATQRPAAHPHAAE
jgi:ubiquinol oxidase